MYICLTVSFRIEYTGWTENVKHSGFEKHLECGFIPLGLTEQWVGGGGHRGHSCYLTAF